MICNCKQIFLLTTLSTAPPKGFPTCMMFSSPVVSSHHMILTRDKRDVTLLSCSQHHMWQSSPQARSIHAVHCSGVSVSIWNFTNCFWKPILFHTRTNLCCSSCSGETEVNMGVWRYWDFCEKGILLKHPEGLYIMHIFRLCSYDYFIILDHSDIDGIMISRLSYKKS